MPRTILDVSKWQGRIDWDKVKTSGKIDGVMLRVLGSKGGKPYVDPAFERNYAACTARGIPVGGYYYTCAVTPRQTEEELAALKTALRGKNVPAAPCHRCGGPPPALPGPRKAFGLVVRAADRIETWNLYAMVYTYTNFCRYRPGPPSRLAPYDLWLADYRGKRPARRHGMWQYTAEGTVPGISGPVDLSVAYKDYAGIIQRAGLGQVRG